MNVGVNIISFSFSLATLAVGSYSLSIDLTNPRYEHYDRIEKCLKFEVNRPPCNGNITVLKQNWGYGSIEIPLERKFFANFANK